MSEARTYQLGEETKITITGRALIGIVIIVAGGVGWATTMTLQMSQVQKDVSEIKQLVANRGVVANR